LDNFYPNLGFLVTREFIDTSVYVITFEPEMLESHSKAKLWPSIIGRQVVMLVSDGKVVHMGLKGKNNLVPQVSLAK